MQLKFQIPGIQVETPRLEDHTQQSLPHIEVREFEVQSLRTTTAAPVVDCNADDVFEFVMDDDTVWYFRADDLARRLKTQKRTVGEATEEVFEIPETFEPDGGSTRGFLGDLIKQKIIRLFTNWAVDRTAEGIAKMMERRLNIGLFRIDKSFNLLPKPDFSLNGNAPHLLLIHGTGSNIIGGFNSFLQESSNAWAKIIDHYDERVLGFEHKTWSESPVRNAIDLVEVLPDQIQLDLITHSRGGLVGEILALMAQGVPLSAELLDILVEKEDDTLKREVEKLHGLVQKKQIKVRNFVRVACPIGGTTILSKRLDTWLNIFVNSLSSIPVFTGNPAFEFLSDFVKAVVHERTDPETLPGLACMRPESPLIKFLNNREHRIDSSLYVISGDARSSKFGSKVMVLLADLFFLEEHDLVVPVNSMRIGLKRSNPVKEYFSAEKEVSHFKYFQNEGSQKAILAALTAEKESDALFKVVDMESIVQTRKVPVKPTVKDGAPTLFVIPGIMGTHLKNEESRLWASYPAIITGAMGKLAIDAEGIKPDGLHDPSYAAMVQYFTDKNYNVITLGYDWRKNLLENAAQLREEISKYLHTKKDKSPQSNFTAPYYFIAHSMGGLVLSLALAGEKDFQEKLKASQFRVLLLGVPWKGSFSVPRIFLGQESTVQRIALLDLKHSRKEIQGIIAQYPGLIQLMPRGNDSAKTFFEFWNTQIAGPESDKLPQFETNLHPNDSGAKLTGKPLAMHYLNQVEEQLNNLALDAQHFKYVAGQDTQTPNEFRIEGGKEIKFRSTPAGDGRVPWDTIPTALREVTYYVPAVHGDLASHEKSFDGYLELLEKGSTDLLSRHEPVTRSTALLDWLPQEDLVEYPTARDIDFAIGGRPPQAVVQTTNHKVSVTLTHGDLVHAAHPIMVGHFKGDAILNAEKVIDDQLDDQLSLRKQMGYYPEEIGSNIILIPTKGRFKGGIVVGLGEFGTLTEPTLYHTLHSALVSYLLKVKENGTRGEHVVGVSALLIGSGFGSLMIANSVKALFDAVTDVNRLMAGRKDKQLPLIGELEIVELFRYKAVQTSRLIQNFVKDTNYQHLAFNDKIKKVSGRRDVIPDEVDTGWWHRIKVWHPENATLTKGFDLSMLHFTSLTDRARAEEKILHINPTLVNDLVSNAAKYTGANVKLSKALFELLVPNEFKTYASGLRNMVLIVDKETARYPWELMSSAEKGNEKPISIKAGLIRQLKTSTFRQNVEDAGGRKALVVGDPPLNGKYRQLDGAAEEAKQVVKILEAHDYEVDDHIQKPYMGIITDLMSTPYRILHFAAHGIFNDPVTGQTGILLDDRTILTPSIFKQMRYVPDLVFVNCCSLGKIDTAQEKLLQAKFEVAASIGCELAEIGVKAVIVAGWEVEDKAAKVFSELVYNKLLNGLSYGAAVQDARVEIYNRYGLNNNTWGAYQCYGDPFFTLKVKRDKSESKTPMPPDAEEAILLLENFINRQDTSFHRRNNSSKKPLEILQDIDKTIVKFKDDSRVVEKLAEAYGKIGELKLAFEEYRRLGNFEKATFTYKALEQMYNTRVRLLEEEYKNFSEKEREENQQKYRNQLEEVVKSLQSLLNFGETKERYALVGSAWKRGFMMFRDKSMLEKSAEAYLKALKIQQKNGADYYSFFNYATAYELLAEKKRGLIKPTNDQTTENIHNAEQREKSDPDFWNKTAPSMVYLWELIQAKEEEVTDIKQRLVTNFREAWKIEGNPNNKKSHLDQLKFVRIGIEQNDKIEHNQLKINALNDAEAEINIETD